MAENTDLNLRNSIIYSVFVRNHTPEGTFRALIPDLPRIRSLGTDILWLMPIHPVGKKNRKGSLGSPYANQDYRATDPAYGTKEDLSALADAAHALGMKVIIDVVYHHTSPDSVLMKEHPEYFYHDAAGNPGPRIAEWSDVADLDYGQRGLWNYLIETLQDWARIVDGFRCDVASLVPVPFWEVAREAVEQVHPGCIWLAESVHASFVRFCREEGIPVWSDQELYAAFDMEYEYDIREVMDRYIDGKGHLSNWTDALNFQETAYPVNYIKARCLENHDQPRIASRIRPEAALRNYTALQYFLKGAVLLYAGQEYGADHQPTLFDPDPVDWTVRTDLSGLMTRLNGIRKTVFSPFDSFAAFADDAQDAAWMTRRDGDRLLLGVFSLKGKPVLVEAGVPDGRYENLLGGPEVSVEKGLLSSGGEPVILQARAGAR